MPIVEWRISDLKELSNCGGKYTKWHYC